MLILKSLMVGFVMLIIVGGVQGNEVIYADNFTREKDIAGWTKQHAVIRVLDGVEIASTAKNKHKGFCGIWRKVVIKQGKIRVRCSVEVRGVKLTPRLGAKHYEGGKFQLLMRSSGKNIYRAAKIKFGTFKWEPVSFTVDVPENTKAMKIFLGFQNTTGMIAFRKLKLEQQIDKHISLASVANMGFSDDIAKDGKGGWSDQGRDSDARNFDRKKGIYANVPFHITDPAANDGKAVVVMRSHHFPKGPEQLKLKLKRTAKGKYLYLLHTLCWGKPGIVGQIEVVAPDGKTQRIDVIGDHDVADWWKISRLANGNPGATWSTAGGNDVGLYVSRFPLSVAPDKLIFRSANGESTWLVAGVTISDTLYKPAKRANFVLQANDKWRPLQRTASPRVIPGSALDLSRLGKLPPGRIIVNSKGHLALKKMPNRPIRFFCGSATMYISGSAKMNGRPGVMESNFDTHEKIDAFVDELHRQGYNMFRIHCTNSIVGEMDGGKIKLNSKRLDMIDYLIAKLKGKHIYVMLDLLSRHVGFTGETPWGYKPKLGYNLKIYFDSEVRAHCEEGMRQLLTHVNPYTKLRLIDDPVIAIITGWNEQEFAFIKRHQWKAGVKAWRKFLKKTYGNIVKLNSAWQTTYPGFSAIEPFSPQQISAAGRRGVDLDKFIAACERELLAWYVKTLRGWGYKGLFTNYDMTKSLHYVAIRDEDELDLVTIHNYHAHWTGKGNTQQNQGSAIAGATRLFRGCAGTRIAGKPIIVTEYAAPFWNKYRYEEAFAFTAYAALNDFDGIMRHNHPVSTVNANRMSFESFWDPIAAAQQVESAFIFLRGDVAPASGSVKIRFSEKAVRDAGFYRDAVSATQSRLSLITRMEMETTGSGKKLLSLASDEVAIPLAGVSAVKNNVAGFSSVVDNSKGSFNLEKTIAELKKRGIIPAANRSGSWTSFESSTGELLMDTNRKFMRIDTPRFQGMCAPAGTSLSLSRISIDRFTTDANLSVIALDKTKTIANASRLLVVYATNALNNKMTFRDESFREVAGNRQKTEMMGGNPTLVRAGAFSLRIRNSNAAKLTVYPLAMNGARRAPVPTQSKNGELIIFVDTAKLPDGPAIFFEIVSTDK
jgi:Beta-galactosidase